MDKNRQVTFEQTASVWMDVGTCVATVSGDTVLISLFTLKMVAMPLRKLLDGRFNLEQAESTLRILLEIAAEVESENASHSSRLCLYRPNERGAF